MNKKLKSRIIEKYGTQADFAQAMKMDESIVSRVVRGRRTLQPATKKAWANALEWELEDLFKD